MFDNPDDTAHLFYLSLLGLFVGVYLFSHYRGRLGQAAQHAAIWGLIFLGAVLVIGFSSDLQRMLTGAPQQVNDNTIALSQGQSGHFEAVLEVNGTPVRFLVDTGATNLVLSRRDAETAGIDTARLNYVIPTMTANGRVMSAPVRLDRIELGAFVDRDVPATVNGGELDISLLGMSYLERYAGWRVEGDRMFLFR